MSNQQPQNQTSTNSNEEIVPVGIDSFECLDKIIKASDLEKSGSIQEAIALYRDVLETDREGTYKAIAEKALEGLEVSPASSEQATQEISTENLVLDDSLNKQSETSPTKTTKEIIDTDVIESKKRKSKKQPQLFPGVAAFNNWPIRKKQLVAFAVSEVIALAGLVGVSLFSIDGIQTQLNKNNTGSPIANVDRETPEKSLNTLMGYRFAIAILIWVVVVLLHFIIVLYLIQTIVHPIRQLQEVAQDFSAGKREVRAATNLTSEIGQLSATFNEIADNIVASETDLGKLARQQEEEAQKQRDEKEKLQQEVIKILLEIEGAQDGDLTVRAKVTDSIVGSIADAFNTTIRKLREIVLQVQNVSNQVSFLARGGENSVRELSDAAKNQSGEIDQVLKNVAGINTSIQEVANSASLAAQIARQALTEAREGDSTMDRTVESIEKIRGTVSIAAKKVKQLAESSQEISQIVSIISGISEKTNVLAFNASIEAARAGKNGQGFRVVADEVRRLADRVTDATKEIQQLVGGIQQEIGVVLQTMETGTSEVVIGTDLVGKTKEILQSLANTSQEIDHYLQTISESTQAQTNASQTVNETIEGVAVIAQNTSTEAEDVVKSLRGLVQESETLESSVAQFRLKQ